MDNEKDLRERIARLETLMERSAEDRKEMERREEDRDKKIDEIETKLDTLIRKLDKYEGKLGALTWVFGILMSGLLFFKDELKRWMFGG